MTLSKAASTPSFASLLYLAPLIDTLNRLDSAIADPYSVDSKQIELDLIEVAVYHESCFYHYCAQELFYVTHFMDDGLDTLEKLDCEAVCFCFLINEELEHTPLLEHREKVLSLAPLLLFICQQIERELNRLKSNREGV
ncbi:MAG: hypothetical protein WA154_09875 [Moraxellaceae bacterium]